MTNVNTATAPLRAGETVEFLPGEGGKWAGVRFKVHKMLQVNVELEIPGTTRKLRARPWALRRVTDASPPSSGAVVTTVPYLPSLDTGTFVRVAGAGWRQPADEVYVVLRDNVTTVRLVLAGGQGGRYWPKVPRSYCTPVRVTLSVDGDL